MRMRGRKDCELACSRRCFALGPFQVCWKLWKSDGPNVQHSAAVLSRFPPSREGKKRSRQEIVASALIEHVAVHFNSSSIRSPHHILTSCRSHHHPRSFHTSSLQHTPLPISAIGFWPTFSFACQYSFPRSHRSTRIESWLADTRLNAGHDGLQPCA